MNLNLCQARQKLRTHQLRLSQLPTLSLIDYHEFCPAPVVGVDEVGRGCLAGPVMAAAVCFRSQDVPQGLTDSKLLSETRRDELAAQIRELHWFGIGSATVAEIDEINILQASLLAMRRALQELAKQMGTDPGHVLVDGNTRIPHITWQQTCVVKGDLRVAPISAASIVAKVARDGLMRGHSEHFPQYGFAQHKGYGSAKHREVIAAIGPCPLHRRTFRGVKEFLATGTR